jgi:hypothetical protein
MKSSKSVKKSAFTSDRWSGIFTALLLLMVVVAVLTIVVTQLPANTVSPSLEIVVTPTLDIGEVLPPPPPLVDTTGIVIMGGLLVLLILGVVMRELNWFRRQS